MRMDALSQTGQPEAPSDDQVDVAVRTFQLLGDATRLRLLWALLHGEHSVGELASHVGAQQSAVSQQLAKLRLTQLVRTRRQGTRIFYTAENVHVERLLREALYHADHVAQGLADHRPRP
jgi:DNA-binding transcriptional ArsR family regulator